MAQRFTTTVVLALVLADSVLKPAGLTLLADSDDVQGKLIEKIKKVSN